MSDTRAIATTAFDGAPDGSAYPEHFDLGDPIEGDLADVAIREGWAHPPKTFAEYQSALAARVARFIQTGT